MLKKSKGPVITISLLVSVWQHMHIHFFSNLSVNEHLFTMTVKTTHSHSISN